MLENRHLDELIASAISEDIARLNFESISDKEVLSRLIPDIDSSSGKVHPDAQWRWTNSKYQDLGLSGWYCGGGTHLLTMQDSQWGCFKSDNPRIDSNKSELLLKPLTGISPKLHLNLINQSCWFACGIHPKVKPIKYEHPVGVSTEIFALRITPAIWELIARRYSVALPENYNEVIAMPWIFWQWVLDNPKIPAIITEGAKKAAAILSCGYVAIALPGVNNGYRTPKDAFGEADGITRLIPQLQALAQPDRRIYLCFDKDSKWKTVRAVNKALSKTANLFIREKCSIKIIDWTPALGKGIDDVIFACGRDAFDNLYRDALDFGQWETKSLKQLTYKADLELNQRYMGEFLPPADAQFICLKAPKGTGKTEWIARITDPIIRSGEKRVLLLSHRVQLATQTVNRLGIPFITEVRATGEGSLFGMGLCIDSLHPKSQAKFNPDEWKGCIIIIDEIQQVIWHLLSSTTCAKERVSILKTLKQLLLNCVNHGGRIIIADADLNDIAIDFIKALAECGDPWIVENIYKFEGNRWDIHSYRDKNPARLVRTLGNHLADGKKILLEVTGQKPSSPYGSRNLEAHFSKKFPELRILRIDSETVSDPNHPAYGATGDINNLIKEYDLVIATPTIETGVSIDEPHFDEVFGIFQGIQSTDSVRQFLARYRLPVPRHIFIKEVGINRVGNGDTIPLSLLSAECKKNNANIKRLLGFGLQDNFLKEQDYKNPALDTWAKMGAIINQGMNNYRAQVLADLAEEGHNIIDVDFKLEEEILDKQVKAEIKETKEEKYAEHTKEIADADSITDIKFETLSKQQSKTKQERLEHRKGDLERRYLIPATPELVKADDKKYYPQVRLHYYFGEGRDFLPDREKGIMESALENGDGNYFLPDTNKALLGNKVAGLDWLDFEKLLATEEISEKHPLAIEIFKKCQENSKVLKDVLGLNFAKESSPIKVIQRLLGLIGFRLPCIRREGSKGNRVRIYGTPAADFQKDEKGKLIIDQGKAIPIPDMRGEIFKAWIERDVAAREKKSQAQSVIETAKPCLEQSEDIETAKACLEESENSEMLKDLLDVFPRPILKAAAQLLDAAMCKWVIDWLNHWEVATA